MTDTFIVDETGEFVVGKAQTTPDDESVGFMASARDALAQWDCSPDEAFGQIASGIFSGTAMLNRLLSRHRPAGRRDRQRRPGGLPADRARRSRHTSASPTRTSCTSRRTTTTRRSCRAS